jgi:hypothetical protein
LKHKRIYKKLISNYLTYRKDLFKFQCKLDTFYSAYLTLRKRFITVLFNLDLEPIRKLHENQEWNTSVLVCDDNFNIFGENIEAQKPF